MDFGKILDKWESKKASEPKKHTMETWLEKNEVSNKDTAQEKTSVPGEKRRRLLNAKPDDILDIHGLTNEKAWLVLDQFFVNAKECNYEKLRIIHGKGNRSQKEAVLKGTVRKYIEQCSFAGESGFENSVNGGTGATWVLLKGT